MAYTFNTTLFRDVVIKSIGPKYIDQAFNETKAVFEVDKQNMLNEFDDHKVTQEIQGEENGTNISKTLGGYGNLFSFIGFQRGTDPIKPVRDVLEESTEIRKVGRGARYNKNSIDYAFPIYMPLMDIELQNAAPMPWGTARSWLKAIEDGISGLNYYLFRRGYDFGKVSRSGPAIQLGGKGTNQKSAEAFSQAIGAPQYTPPKEGYLTVILNKLKLKYK